MAYRASQFIEAIPGSGGIISTIAARVGCHWHTARRFCMEVKAVREVYDDEVEKTYDMAEAVVLKALQKEDVPTAKWYLTMKAANRGYAPTQKNEIMSANIDLSTLSDEQVRRIADGEDILSVMANSGKG